MAELTVLDLKITRVANSAAGSRELQATWDWKKDDTKEFEVTWDYKTSDNLWVNGSSGSVKSPKYSSYTAPSNAISVRVKVKPIPTKKQWTASAKTVTFSLIGTWTTPSTPDCTMDTEKKRLTCTVRYKNDNAVAEKRKNLTVRMRFRLHINRTTDVDKYETIDKETGLVSHTFTSAIPDGARLEVAVQVVNKVTTTNKKGKKITTYEPLSDLSDWAGPFQSRTVAPEFTKVQAASSSSIYLKWGKVDGALSYNLEYATDKSDFTKNPEKVEPKDVTGNSYTVNDLAGDEYFFRIRSVGQGDVKSVWSEIVSCTVGKKPNPPTTWTLENTTQSQETIRLYWNHNSSDNSSETYAVIEMTSDQHPSPLETQPIPNPNINDEDLKDATRYYDITPSKIPAVTYFTWKVKTRGATDEYSDWSVERTIKIADPPTLQFVNAIPKVLEHFPLGFTVQAGPKQQKAIRYFVSITPNEGYVAYHNDGTPFYVGAGDELYSSSVSPAENSPNTQTWSILPSDVDLQSDILYTLTVGVTMDTGLGAEITAEFTPVWNEEIALPFAKLEYNENDYTMSITPYSESRQVFDILDSNGNPVLDNTGQAISSIEFIVYDNVLYSVYRREVDGTFTPILEMIDNPVAVTIQDPHPTLDYARYRIVAIDRSTGAMSFTDIPGYEIHEPGIILQWDVDWQTFDAVDEDIESIAEIVHHGYTLRLPYNIDSNQSYDHDVSLVEYIGRKHPVAYYGTQTGETASYSLVVPKEDEDTINELRRLGVYAGDVYVRTPNGLGYWANVKVGMSHNHTEVIVPVTLDVTRVEGGL